MNFDLGPSELNVARQWEVAGSCPPCLLLFASSICAIGCGSMVYAALPRPMHVVLLCRLEWVIEFGDSLYP